MEWSDLKIFLAAVRAGSYTAAGPQVGVNRTTVGRRVAALEAAVGRPLFLEAPTGPQPTAEGQMVLEAALRIEAEVAAMLTAIGLAPPNPVPIRIAGSAGLAGEVLEMLASAEMPAVELVSGLDPIDAVTRRRADLAIALVRAVPRRLSGVHVGLVAQAVYARRESAGHGRLGWGPEVENALPRHWTAANIADQGDVIGLFNSWGDLKMAVLAGMGRAWLPCFIAEPDPRLVRVGAPDPRFETGLWLLHRADAPRSAGAVQFMETLAASLAGRLSRAQAV